jgi:hypothetical protein
VTSNALIETIETKLKAYGLKKVIPDDDLLAETYRAFRRSDRLRERFEEMEQEFDGEDDADEEDATDEQDAGDQEKEAGVQVPKDLKERVRAILAVNDDLRWDDAIRLVLDKTQLNRVRAEKEKAKEKSGDFTGASEDDDTAGASESSKPSTARERQAIPSRLPGNLPTRSGDTGRNPMR